MTITVYNHADSAHRGYDGVQIDEENSTDILGTIVRENLVDQEEVDNFQSDLEELKGSIQQAGFEPNEQLLLDIQSLNNPEPEDTRTWRIGEAIAEVVLEKNFRARFYWNELRDTRNPKGNKPGADLVGFIEHNGGVLFLFGEVKTSSEGKRPPQVMTASGEIEDQLRDLYADPDKRKLLIRYLANKTRNLPPDHSFIVDYHSALTNYYRDLSCTYQLFGVLVRDIDPAREDISESYERLAKEILNPAGIRLLAIYISVEKKDWESIINQSDTNE